MTPLITGFTLFLSAVPGDVYVADAGTLVISGTRVALLGVDIPRSNAADVQHALDVMRNMTSDAHVICEVTQEKGDGRRVGRCFADGKDIGAALVEAGIALDCPRYSSGAYRTLETPGARDRLPRQPECGVRTDESP